MNVEVAETNSVVIMESGSEAEMLAENGKVNITFGSHGVDEPVKVEVEKASESNLPKDAVDEWPEPQQTHSFYVVRYRPIEDQKLKVKLDLTEKELMKKNQSRVQMIEKLRSKRAERAQVVAQIRSLSVENKQFRSIMDEKRKEMEPLQQALGKLRGSSGGGRERSSGLCSSEQELNGVIKSLEYRIQHESIPLTEEKQILREIKQLEGTRGKVIENAAEMAKIQDSLGEKDTIQDQVKLIGVGLDGVRKEKQVVHDRLKQLDEEKMVIEKDIGALEDELTSLTEKRDQTYDNIREMRKQREEGNTPFYENRNLLTKAKVLAANKDIEALKRLSDTEVEKIMSVYSSNKAFRDDYERRSLQSLDMRQFTRDGRLRNLNEKPIFVVDPPAQLQPEIVKASVKQIPKEEIVLPVPVDAVSEQKVQKTKKEGNKKSEKIDQEDQEEFIALPTKVEVVVDEKKLKEIKREEEIAKRNQAEERKKKLAEKAATKASIKAQKEAEKKLKEREKKSKKKSGAGVSAVESEEPAEVVAEVAEPAKEMEEKIETFVPQKNKARKENTIRSRAARARGPDSLPRAILKRKKGTNYWMWIGPAAAVAILVLMVVVSNYLK